MKKFGILSLIIFLFYAQPASAQMFCPLAKEVPSVESLKAIPVLENGRIKPLDTYARNLLLQFSGRRSYDRQEAIKWLARFLFSPASTKDNKIFLINHPEIVEALEIEKEKKRRYSFTQIEPSYDRLQQLAADAMKIDEKERDLVENEIIRVYSNLNLYSKLSLSFSFAYPHPDFTISDIKTISELDLPRGSTTFSFLDIALKAEELRQITLPLENTPQDQWTQKQKEVLQAISNLFSWSMLYQNIPLQLIPSYVPNDENWYSPWDSTPIALPTEEGRAELDTLRNIMAHYWNGRQLEFDIAARAYTNSVLKRLSQKSSTPKMFLKTEILYNKLNAFFWAKILYLISFLLFFVALLFKHKIFKGASASLIVIAFALHTLGIILRIIILQRPPVSNLYETFLFVGFVSVLTGLLIERFNKQWLGLIIASLSGYIFLTIADKFGTEGDTLQMLVAVLNSNFWLSTHVITITIGYSGACVAGIIGHVYILQVIFRSKDTALLKSTYKALLGALGFALTMTFLGTNLGGIWADQSWGRFWGWDPKENGALLIILWTAILFHAKVGRMIGPLGLAVGSALGGIVVMWAWFGVNLLSIGLHSYGFTSGLAKNLMVYYLTQLLFVTITYPIAKQKHQGLKI